MRGSSVTRETVEEIVQTKGFDDYRLRLGDIMRGERATMGKSLLDVQRELKIKAAYIAAVENADPDAFDTPGFIAGYVRSYARYLNMDPDEAFQKFCDESGFQTAHGMSDAASMRRSARTARAKTAAAKDPIGQTGTPFVPASESVFSGFQPQALGSLLVLLSVISGIGYGGWALLQEVQRVQFAPVDQTPVVVSEFDAPVAPGQTSPDVSGGLAAPTTAGLDRLYRPQALDVPVLVARDGPISALTPGAIGTIAPAPLAVPEDDIAIVTDDAVPTVQVVAPDAPELKLVAVRPAWVRVRSAEGTVLFEGVMQPGEGFEVPSTQAPSILRVGESGALYFAINGVHHGPVGETGVVTSGVALDTDALAETYAVADISADADLAEIVNVAEVVSDQ